MWKLFTVRSSASLFPRRPVIFPSMQSRTGCGLCTIGLDEALSASKTKQLLVCRGPSQNSLFQVDADSVLTSTQLTSLHKVLYPFSNKSDATRSHFKRRLGPAKSSGPYPQFKVGHQPRNAELHSKQSLLTRYRGGFQHFTQAEAVTATILPSPPFPLPDCWP